MRSYTNFNEFATDLENTTGIKVYQYRTEGDVHLPYIVCGESRDASVMADDMHYHEAMYIDVLLFTYQDNSITMKNESEHKLRAFFTERKIPYRESVDWLEALELFQTSYFVRVSYGK